MAQGPPAKPPHPYFYYIIPYIISKIHNLNIRTLNYVIAQCSIEELENNKIFIPNTELIIMINVSNYNYNNTLKALTLN